MSVAATTNLVNIVNESQAPKPSRSPKFGALKIGTKPEELQLDKSEKKLSTAKSDGNKGDDKVKKIHSRHFSPNGNIGKGKKF